ALFTDQQRRLGDLAAGTLLLRDEQIRLDHYLAPKAAPGPRIPETAATSSALEGPVAALLTSYLARLEDFTPDARTALARTFLQKLGGSLDAPEREALAADPVALEQWLRSLSASAPVMARPVACAAPSPDWSARVAGTGSSWMDCWPVPAPGASPSRRSRPSSASIGAPPATWPGFRPSIPTATWSATSSSSMPAPWGRSIAPRSMPSPG